MYQVPPLISGKFIGYRHCRVSKGSLLNSLHTDVYVPCSDSNYRNRITVLPLHSGAAGRHRFRQEDEMLPVQ